MDQVTGHRRGTQVVTLPQRALDDLSQQRLRFFGPEIAQGPSQLNGDRQFVFGALAGAGRQPQDGDVPGSSRPRPPKPVASRSSRIRPL